MYIHGKHTIAITPSETVKDLMETHEMSPESFAKRMALSDEDAKKFLDDYLPMTDELAFRLASEFEPSATFWKNLEHIFLENRERIEFEI